MNLLEMNHIQKSFDGVQVLKDISLSVKQGEVLSSSALPDPENPPSSGALPCWRPSTGERSAIWTGGRPGWRTESLRGRKGRKRKKIQSYFGLVFQSFNLFPHYSVIRNITDAPIHVQKRNKEEGVPGGQKSAGQNGTGGQGGRVSLSAVRRPVPGGWPSPGALALNPKILFFDEPTSALDPELTGEVLKVIRSLADLDITMVIVTHEMEFARNISDRIIFMDKGLIEVQGTPDEVFQAEHTRMREFLGKIHQN